MNREMEGPPEGGKIVRFEALRALLAEKFPSAQGVGRAVSGDGKIPPGALTEVSGSSGSVALFLESALSCAPGFAAWIGEGLDPVDLPQECLRRLLWVRCRRADHAIRAADLLLRDGNLGLVILDLRRADAAEWHRIPMSTWHRFQRLLEQTPVALAVGTARASIPAARVRLTVRQEWTLGDLLRSRKELSESLAVECVRRGVEPARRLA